MCIYIYIYMSSVIIPCRFYRVLVDGPFHYDHGLLIMSFAHTYLLVTQFASWWFSLVSPSAPDLHLAYSVERVGILKGGNSRVR